MIFITWHAFKIFNQTKYSEGSSVILFIQKFEMKYHQTDKILKILNSCSSNVEKLLISQWQVATNLSLIIHL